MPLRPLTLQADGAVTQENFERCRASVDLSEVKAVSELSGYKSGVVEVKSANCH